jgi:hypothetical protein
MYYGKRHFYYKARLSFCSSDLPSEPPRWLTKRKSLPNENLGISIVGQANFGIFVKEVQPNSCVFGHEGLRCGDQILEVRAVKIKKF